ncbi:MAG: NADPH-dependent F420 reductase [Asgard group archaeon]|nr:NADPH-dependent F420 reductase [Asgard group archaeon]
MIREDFELSEQIIGLVPGTGKQSKGIALRLGKAGYNVLIGSRNEEKAVSTAKELNEQIGKDYCKGFSNEEIVKRSDIIFLVVPPEYLESTLQKLNPFFKEDAIIVDVNVPLKFEEGICYFLESDNYKSASEHIQAIVPKHVSVIGAFKTISAAKLNNLNRPLDVDVFLTSDYQETINTIQEILSKIDGLRVLNAGPLMFSRTTEQMTALVININKLNKLKHASFKVMTTHKK